MFSHLPLPQPALFTLPNAALRPSRLMRWWQRLALSAGCLTLTAFVAPVAHSATFTLTGSELKLRTIAQSTPTSPLLTTSFPVAATVSESAVEFPTVASLFDPNATVPPGFARSLANVAIEAGADYLEVDFDNAGSNRFASAFQNTYVFTFTNPVALQITEASLDASTTLGLTADRVTFSGNELFVNVQGLPFNPNSYARINLSGTLAETPEPAAVPEPSALLFLGGTVLLGLVGSRRV